MIPSGIFLEFLEFIFVIKIKKDNTVIRDCLTVIALLPHTAVLFPTNLAPIIDEPVITSANIFLKSALIQTLHFAISIVRIGNKA